MPPVVAAVAAAPGLATLGAAGLAAAGSVIGSRSQAGASRRAADSQERATMAALAEERARREEERAQWEAAQQFERERFAAQEEERLFQRRLLEEAEARRAPYRAAGQAALGNLGRILGFQLPAPRMGSMGSGGMSGGRTAAIGLRPLTDDTGLYTRGPATEVGYTPVNPMIAPMGQQAPPTMGDLMRFRRR